MKKEKIAKYFEQIPKYLRDGKHNQTKQVIGKVLKLGPFSEAQKNLISQWQLMVGENLQAIKTIGAELSLEELENATSVTLLLQFRLAFLLVSMGAPYSARRISEKVLSIAEAKNIKMGELFDRYPLMLIVLYRQLGMEETALEAADQALQFYPPDHFLYYHVIINQADLLRGKKQFSQVVNLTTKYLNQDLKNLEMVKFGLWRSQAETHLGQGDNSAAMECLTKAQEILPQKANMIEALVLKRCLGECFYNQNNFSKAEQYFCQALDQHQVNHLNAKMILANLYWLFQIPGLENKKYGLGWQISLACHPCNSAYSYLVGKKYIPELSYPLPQLFLERYQQKFPNNKNDCWVISKTIQAKSYEEFSPNLAAMAGKAAIIDLYSGIVFKEGKLCEVLSETKLRAIAAIMASGALGCSKWTLMDLVYREGPFDQLLLEDRIKNLLSQIKASGIKIKRKKNFYYFQDYEKFQIILPMGVATLRPYLFLASMHPIFNRQDIEELFSIHRATANRWLKEWREQDLIVPQDDGFVLKNARGNG